MRLSPGSFNPRNSEVWWNCLRSAVSIIDTSGERPSHSVLFGRSLTLHLAVASLKNIWQANQPIRRSVESDHISGLRSRDRAQRTSSERNFTTAKFWRTTPGHTIGHTRQEPETPQLTITEVSHWFDQCDSKRFDR